MFVKKDTLFPAEENESRERLICAVLNAITSPDAEEAGEVMRTLVHDTVTEEGDEYFTTALPLSRCAARAYAPLVWRALLDEAKDGNMTAIKLYFDIFGRDIGMTDEENADPAHDESFSEVRRHKWEIMYSQKSTVST